MRKRPTKTFAIARWRLTAVTGALGILALVLLWNIAGSQVLDGARGRSFLQSEGAAQSVRAELIPAYRGVITDRRGEPLAVSTPVFSIVANPKEMNVELQKRAKKLGVSAPELQRDLHKRLADKLGISPSDLKRRLERFANKSFVYLARRITPDQAQGILDLKISGISSELEYKRFYPAGEVTAQLIGKNDANDAGKEGIELAYDKSLTGIPGKRRVIQDIGGRAVKDLGLVRSEKAGANLVLSLDLRLQYVAYRELKAAIAQFGAASGCMVVLDARTGEVLAMVNQPSFNPNTLDKIEPAALRNRAVIDVVEPGSLMKPLTMVAALESGKFNPHTPIDTAPGSLRIAGKTFYDHHNYGLLDLTGIITKSSQVGVTKVAMQLSPAAIRGVFERVGLGQGLATGFPGERAGSLPGHTRWRPVEHATMAFGYGMQATALQLARAYSVIASDGRRRPISLLKTPTAPAGEQVIDPAIARAVREMMKTVIQPGGTGTRAGVPSYVVSGKTGTVHQVGSGGYRKHDYTSLFAGMLPADDPRLVGVVIINQPRGKEYFGGLVAAPVFGRVMTEAVRLLRIPPALPAGQRVVAMDAPSRPGGI